MPSTVTDAARTPHGDSNRRLHLHTQRYQPDAARTPHGDSNTGDGCCACITTRMQPAPLTGTVTFSVRVDESYKAQDAARTPHGDSNPSGSSRTPRTRPMQPAPLTGTVTQTGCPYWTVWHRMQPAPLTGTVTSLALHPVHQLQDAARTPHRDSNYLSISFLTTASPMQPAPLTGTATSASILR